MVGANGEPEPPITLPISRRMTLPYHPMVHDLIPLVGLPLASATRGGLGAGKGGEKEEIRDIFSGSDKTVAVR